MLFSPSQIITTKEGGKQATRCKQGNYYLTSQATFWFRYCCILIWMQQVPASVCYVAFLLLLSRWWRSFFFFQRRQVITAMTTTPMIPWSQWCYERQNDINNNTRSSIPCMPIIIIRQQVQRKKEKSKIVNIIIIVRFCEGWIITGKKNAVYRVKSL